MKVQVPGEEIWSSGSISGPAQRDPGILRVHRGALPSSAGEFDGFPAQATKADEPT